MTLKINFLMKQAIKIASKSDIDIPVGAIIIDEMGKIISVGVNLKERKKDVTLHAEIVAIKRATKKLNTTNLSNCIMFVTLEPCPMCATVIINSKIKKLYFGAFDNLYGSFGSKIDLRKIFNSKIEVKGGFLEEECTNLLKNYFKGIRN